MKYKVDFLRNICCTVILLLGFSSAIASFLALGNSLYKSVELAQNYTYQAITKGQNTITGQGNGALNHFFHPSKMIKNKI